MEILQDGFHIRCRDTAPDALIQFLRDCPDDDGLLDMRIRFDDTGDGMAGSHLFDEIHSPVQGVMVQDSIHTALEALGSFTAQAQLLGCTADDGAVKCG